MRGPSGDNSVPCDVYLDGVELRTQSWLSELKSPNGTPLLEVFQEELGLDSTLQARFILYREMMRAAGPAVPAPSLTGMYAGLRGASVAGRAGQGAIEGGLGGWAGNTVARLLGSAIGKGSAIGLATGAIKGLGAEFQRTLDSLASWVGFAAFLVWYAPYMLGVINEVLVGLFPFVVLWSLWPGQQLQPLALYFVTLLFTNSSPLWWALIDQAQKVAGATSPQSTDGYAAGLTNLASAFAWSTVVTVVGILLVPLVVGILLFLAFRTSGGLWRAAA
jgi:hypothetical protein